MTNEDKLRAAIVAIIGALLTIIFALSGLVDEQPFTNVITYPTSTLTANPTLSEPITAVYTVSPSVTNPPATLTASNTSTVTPSLTATATATATADDPTPTQEITIIPAVVNAAPCLWLRTTWLATSKPIYCIPNTDYIELDTLVSEGVTTGYVYVYYPIKDLYGWVSGQYVIRLDR